MRKDVEINEMVDVLDTIARTLERHTSFTRITAQIDVLIDIILEEFSKIGPKINNFHKTMITTNLQSIDMVIDEMIDRLVENDPTE